jgi:hypothetical protein
MGHRHDGALAGDDSGDHDVWEATKRKLTGIVRGIDVEHLPPATG